MTCSHAHIEFSARSLRCALSLCFHPVLILLSLLSLHSQLCHCALNFVIVLSTLSLCSQLCHCALNFVIVLSPHPDCALTALVRERANESRTSDVHTDHIASSCPEASHSVLQLFTVSSVDDCDWLKLDSCATRSATGTTMIVNTEELIVNPQELKHNCANGASVCSHRN